LDLAAAYLAVTDTPNAEAELAMFEAESSRNPEIVHLMIAEVWAAAEMADDALSELDRALDLAARGSDDWERIVSAWVRWNVSLRSADSLDEILLARLSSELDVPPSNNPPSLDAFTRAIMDNLAPERAITLLRSLSESRSDAVLASLAYASALFEEGRVGEAQAVLDEFANRGDYADLALIGEWFYEHDSLVEASQIWLRSLDYSPEPEWELDRLVELYVRRGWAYELESLVPSYLDYLGDDLQARVRLAAALERLDLWNSIVTVLEPVAERIDDPNTVWQLGEAFFDGGRSDDELALYQAFWERNFSPESFPRRTVERLQDRG
ncbi:MAG: hypothetical protein KC561_21025, partial [Myxococcales bacterium]|nr:hypothetical protein [Myxococcales bacterium]